MGNKKINIKNKFLAKLKRPFLTVLVFYFVFFPIISQAATMSVQTLVAQVAPGKNFSIRVSVNTQGKTINNAEAIINFPTALVEVVSVSSGGIFSLWVEPPAFSNAAGTISFNGGVPNPGFTGSGQIMTAVFKAKKAGTARFSLSGAAIRENDGLGTNIISGQGGSSILIIDAKPEPPKKPVEPPKPPTPDTEKPVERVVITSPTHPDSNLWSKGSKATFVRQQPSGATASQTSFDQNPNGIPTVTRRPAMNRITIDSVGNGVWYFHARFLVGQTWTPVFTYKIQVDSSAPENVNATIKKDTENRLSAVMTATDKDSGLAYYTVQIDTQMPVTVTATDNETVALLSPLSKGPHTITVVAFDKAGNNTTKVVNFENLEDESIRISDYSREIEVNDQIKVTGLAPADTDLRVTLSTENGLLRYYYIKSQPNGDFTFLSEPIAGGEKFSLWVEREASEGKPGLSSERIEISVKDSFWVNVRSWFIGLEKLITFINILILALFLFGLYGWYKYFRLRRQVNKGKKSTVKSLGEVIKKIKK